MKINNEQQEKIDSLFNLDFPEEFGRFSRETWLNYLDLGYNEDDIPTLIDIATDKYLLSDEACELAISAPIHAWRALAQLKAHQALEPIIACFDAYEDFGEIGTEEIPVVIGMIGEAAIEPMYKCLQDNSKEGFSRIIAAEGLKQAIYQHDNNIEILHKVVARFTAYLKSPDQDEHVVNAAVVSSLLDLHNIQPLPEDTILAIKSVYEQNIADMGYAGDLKDIEMRLGL